MSTLPPTWLVPCTVLWATTPVVVDAEGNEVGHGFYDPFGSVLTSTLPATLTDRHPPA